MGQLVAVHVWWSPVTVASRGTWSECSGTIRHCGAESLGHAQHSAPESKRSFSVARCSWP